MGVAVPVQIRRSGRDNARSSISMTQWFPKIAAYDEEGYINPYIAREFLRVGDYDVKITIDSRYTIGASGYLQNPEEVAMLYR